MRIRTIKPTIREIARFRSGWSDPVEGKRFRRPVKSTTWLVTSQDRDVVETAARIWGGVPEQWTPQNSSIVEWRVVSETSTVEALLPPGDPLSSALEMWSGGGVSLRCDGEKIQTGEPCVCQAKFGDEFYELSAKQVCKPVSRLKLLVPDFDLGIVRAETHSYFAVGEWSGWVDLVRQQLGPTALIPITLTIQERSKIKDGKRSVFPVVVLGLRGMTTAGILTGAPSSNGQQAIGQREQIALGSRPQEPEEVLDPDWWAYEIEKAVTVEELAALREVMIEHSVKADHPAVALFKARMVELSQPPAAIGQVAEEPPQDEEPDEQPAEVEQQPVPPVGEQVPDVALGDDWAAQLESAGTLEDLATVKAGMVAAGVGPDDPLVVLYTQRRRLLLMPGPVSDAPRVEAEPTGQLELPAAPEPAMHPRSAEPAPKAENAVALTTAWMGLLAAAGTKGLSTEQVEQRYQDRFGHSAKQGSVALMNRLAGEL